ncbi:hypothetical protein BKA63DRAFT_129519 [Paraphoma chrysanthemicola]|nr:hypothetical protein BKA63DRAFT_129519 [Paraphoma chrysanthemicola]
MKESDLKDLSTSHQVGSEAMSENSGHGQTEFRHLNHNPSATWNYSAMRQETADTSFPPEIMDVVQTLGPASGLNSVLIATGQAAQLLDATGYLQPRSPATTVPPYEVAGVLLCPRKDCPARYTGKYGQGNLNRHLRLKHGSKERLYLCEQEGCGKTFKRQDYRLNHYRMSHSSPPERIASTVRANKMERMLKPISSKFFPHLEVPEALLSPALPCSASEPAVESETLTCTVDGCSSQLTGAHQNLCLNHAQKGETFDCEARGCAESFQQPDARLEHYRIRHPDLAPEFNSSHSGHERTQTAPLVDDMISKKLDKVLPRYSTTSQSVTPGSRHHSPEERSGEDSKRDFEVIRAPVPKWRSIGGPDFHHDEAGNDVESHGQTTLEADISGHNEFENEPNHPDSSLGKIGTPDASDTDERSTSSSSNDQHEQDDVSHMVDKLGRIRLWDWLTAVRTRGHGNGSNAHDSTPISSDTSASRSTPTGRTLAGSKRSAEDRPDDDPGEKKRRKRRSRIMVEQGQVAEGMFACPFPKRDPRRHIRCWDFVFDKSKFPDLKQHFERHHLIPFHCPRCGLEFTGVNKDAERGGLLCQQPQCPEVNLLGRWIGVTADQWEMIKKPKRRTMTEHHYWMHIYSILFASQPISGHPYHEDYKALEAQILISTISSAVTNSIIPFLVAQGALVGPSNANQTDLANSVRNLVAAGVNDGFSTAGIEVDRRPAPCPLRTLSATATAPDLRGITEDLLFHVPVSALERPSLPPDTSDSVHNDTPASMNDHPHGGPSNAITETELDTRGDEDSPTSRGRLTPLFDSSTFIDWNTSDQSLFSEYVAVGRPDQEPPDIDE